MPKKNISYSIKFASINDKPQNLKFKIKGKDEKYSTLEELGEKMKDDLTGQTEVNKKITIEWEWQYENDEQNNIQDTKDGEKLTKYQFMIRLMGNEKMY